MQVGQWLGGVLCVLVLGSSCGDSNKRFVTIDPTDGENDVRPGKKPGASPPGADAGDASSAEGDASAGPGGATSPDAGDPSSADGGPAVFAKNCGDNIICAGTKACVEDPERGVAFCDCDKGFTREELDGDEFECVLDKSCIRVKALFRSCHQSVGGQPLATSFYTVEYCGGVPVPAKTLGGFEQAFEVLQDEKLPDPDETYVKIVERDVESVVTLALDVSGSILEEENKGEILKPMVARLRTFVGQMKNVPGPPVVVSMLTFGRRVAEFITATTDLESVDRQLAALETEAGQQAVKELVGTNGTELYDAVKKGIQQTERLQTFRRHVSQNGVLTSGTVVIITDGEDASGGVLDETLLQATSVNVVSIGINEAINDLELTAIGKSGSFLAPNPEDWTSALDEISQRVRNRNRSVYGTLFCSAATKEEHVLRTRMKGSDQESGVICPFDAAQFGKDLSESCEDVVNSFCGVQIDPADGRRRCGGIMACGSECEVGECCNDENECVAPAPAPDCAAQNQLCRPGGNVCMQVPEVTPVVYACGAPALVGEDCSVTACAEGEAYCDPITKLCVATLGKGERCEAAAECASLNCVKRGPALDGSVCESSARMFDVCSGDALASCELGSYCQSTCLPRELNGCSADQECLSGRCNTEIQRCIRAESCQFAWDDKVEF